MKKAWLDAIKRDKFEPTRHSRVCSKHFKPSDYVEQSWASAQAGAKKMKNLKKGTVPSVFQWTLDEPESAREEQRRAKEAQQCVKVNEAGSADIACAPIMLCEIEIKSENVNQEDNGLNQGESNDPGLVDAASQTDANTRAEFSIFKFQPDAKVINYYTGLDNYDHFMLIFNLMGPAAHELNYGQKDTKMVLMDPRDALFLTLIKLRRNLPNFELSVMFGVSESTVANIFQTWLNFMYFEMKEWDIKPSDSEQSDVRIILDCTEMKIEQPSNPTLQQATYSSYKSANTVKVLVGISQTCLVTFVSDAFCGSYSDNVILSSSKLLDDLEEGDVILADRGFQIEQMCAERGLVVNVPSSLRGKSQLSLLEMRKSTHISSRRIHVERIIGLAKTYRMLSQKFHSSRVLQTGRIIYVCFMLANLRRRIV